MFTINGDDLFNEFNMHTKIIFFFVLCYFNYFQNNRSPILKISTKKKNRHLTNVYQTKILFLLKTIFRFNRMNVNDITKFKRWTYN